MRYVGVQVVAGILLASVVGFVFNEWVLPSPTLNFMLLGMAFSATFANMIPVDRVERLMKDFNPVLGIAMIIVILNLGAPLDYHLVVNAGLFTPIYIVSRAFGKYFGPDPASSQIIQGTIAAAAVINEIIAVIVAKKGFEWAGEIERK